MMLEPLGEVGAHFSLQLSSRTQFTKINTKKVIAKNQCEKHKKSSLVCLKIFFTFTNSVDPDEMQQHAAFHLGYHCLQNYSLRGFLNA